MLPVDELTLPAISVRLDATVTRDIHWNSYPGSVMHGVLGLHLKEISCATKHRVCKGCYLVPTCGYGMIFESPVPEGSERMRKYPQTPHPLRLSVQPWNVPRIEADSRFSVEVTLVGPATGNLIMVLMALQAAFSEGLGRVHDGRRGCAQIERVTDLFSGHAVDWMTLLDRFRPPVAPRTLGELVSAARTGGDDLRITFESPVRLVTDGRANFKPTLRDLTANILRKISNYSHFYSGKEPDWPYESLVATALDLTCEYQLSRLAARRYSHRQQSSISVSGVVGEIMVRNCPPDLRTVLHAGEILGVGKGTSMGLGRIQVEEC